MEGVTPAALQSQAGFRPPDLHIGAGTRARPTSGWMKNQPRGVDEKLDGKPIWGPEWGG